MKSKELSLDLHDNILWRGINQDNGIKALSVPRSKLASVFVKWKMFEAYSQDNPEETSRQVSDCLWVQQTKALT